MGKQDCSGLCIYDKKQRLCTAPCWDVEPFDEKEYKDNCGKYSDDKKTCAAMGCKLKKSRKSNASKCTPLKKIKCKKLDREICCSIPGCSLGAKKCEGDFAGWK